MHWAKLFGLAFGAEAALIASAVVFMLVYSSAIHPGETPEFYNARARVLLPYVAVVVSFPVFYWLARYSGGWTRSLIFWGFHVAIDIAISAATDGITGLVAILPFWLLSQAAKLLGCWFGTRHLEH